jgi:cobalt-zinc-cadmium efflux system outer membrane protein
VRSEALLSFARRSRVPDLGLSLFHQKELDRDAWGVSFGVTLPLWNAKRGEIAKADAAAALARAEAERTSVALATALEERRRDVDVAASQAAVLTGELLPAASESLRTARLLFEEGETSLLDLLDAQRTARDARREEIRARFELAVALSELERLIGRDDTTMGDRK